MFKNRTIDYNSSILEALKLMDEFDVKLLIVLKKISFEGLISIGDIQRAIIKNIDLSTKISKILRREIKIASKYQKIDSIKKMMFEYRMELCPVVDENHNIIKVYFWEDFYSNEKPKPIKKFDLPVVIMAGGIGTRMKPITNVIPKPLIPIGDQTIIEDIFHRFYLHGSNRFFISVNYKAELMKFYLENQKLPYNLDFFSESKPMGTAGSLSLLKGKIKETFFISNCDILIEQDYSEILAYHRENKNEITIIAALKHFPIAYGIVETGDNGSLKGLVEKPELTFKINSGMYILESSLIDEIPEDEFYHITHLIEKVKSRGGNVGVFPVSEKSWKDIGNWKDYNKEINGL